MLRTNSCVTKRIVYLEYFGFNAFSYGYRIINIHAGAEGIPKIVFALTDTKGLLDNKIVRITGTAAVNTDPEETDFRYVQQIVDNDVLRGDVLVELETQQSNQYDDGAYVDLENMSTEDIEIRLSELEADRLTAAVDILEVDVNIDANPIIS